MSEKAKWMADSLRGFLIAMPRSAKTAISVTADLAGFGVCVLAALWLMQLGPYAISHSLVVVATALISVCLVWWQGMYRSVVRYMGFDLFVAGGFTAAGSTVAGAMLMRFFVFGSTPYRWAVAYAAFSLIYIYGSRYFVRLFLLKRRANEDRKKVIIYGAGSAGVQLSVSLRGGNEFLPVAMLDDDPTLYGKKVKGLNVHPPSMIETLCRQFDAKCVFLAIPNTRRRRRRQILEQLSEFPVHVQTIPDLKDIISGKASVDDVSDVDVHDLLGRDSVPPNPALLGACVTGKNVMVTGAGGSIGSELCRQLLKLDPRRLVLLDNCEAALYSIDRKLKEISRKLENNCKIVPLLGSVHHEGRVREVMETFSIQTVYHSAAYKHVPIVEHNLIEGIYNNVFGTLHTARAAIDSGVETFVLISTDKAVSPTSVMGATKRFAELILQAYNSRADGVRFCMVRFGNVLESSGSVVPLFREQIRNGGPITVTHRDIIRYFMTIPEAAELVIQAGSMARGGDVFVLDMGEPIRILDLAYRMISLMGRTVQDDANPDGDIEIQFIGLRPAEKLYEELLIGANVTGTRHPRIMRADEDFIPIDALSGLVDDLKAAAGKLDYDRTRGILLRAVQEYRPNNGIDDLVWVNKNGVNKSSGTPDTVIDFPSKQG